MVEAVQRGIEETMGIRLDAPLTELKYAYYPNGGHYRRHVDALNAGIVTAREWSFICYLNNGWRESDGGHPRVYLDYEAGPRDMATPKDAPYSVLHAGAGAASPSMSSEWQLSVGSIVHSPKLRLPLRLSMKRRCPPSPRPFFSTIERGGRL
eukprot:FR738657.1.p1 GENE.FR738657.1~~FR738657.1.p1  ORF type:complete len:152 (+),score=2.52 FR738657.1:192-647(+)